MRNGVSHAVITISRLYQGISAQAFASLQYIVCCLTSVHIDKDLLDATRLGLSKLSIPLMWHKVEYFGNVLSYSNWTKVNSVSQKCHTNK